MQLVSKIVRVGNSRGVILPMVLVKALGLELGREVRLEETKRGVLVTWTKEKKR